MSLRRLDCLAIIDSRKGTRAQYLTVNVLVWSQKSMCEIYIICALSWPRPCSRMPGPSDPGCLLYPQWYLGLSEMCLGEQKWILDWKTKHSWTDWKMVVSKHLLPDYTQGINASVAHTKELESSPRKFISAIQKLRWHFGLRGGACASAYVSACDLTDAYLMVFVARSSICIGLNVLSPNKPSAPLCWTGLTSGSYVKWNIFS